MMAYQAAFNSIIPEILALVIDTMLITGKNINIVAAGNLSRFLGGREMKLIAFLDESGVKYETTQHRPTFTAQSMAAEEHESGKYVAKPVIVKADGKYVMCVLAACHKVDLSALKSQLGAKSLDLAEEKEIGELFGDCQLGAEPPFGNLYDLPTVIDKALEQDDHIIFQAGSHEQAIRMSMADYQKLVKPKVLAFSYHVK